MAVPCLSSHHELFFNVTRIRAGTPYKNFRRTVLLDGPRKDLWNKVDHHLHIMLYKSKLKIQFDFNWIFVRIKLDAEEIMIKFLDGGK